MKFTDDELKVITSSLIFTSCVEACANFDVKDSEVMINIAEKIMKEKKIEFPKNVEIFGFAEEDEYHNIFLKAKALENGDI